MVMNSFVCHVPGGKVSRDAGPVKGGQTVIAFADDPTGYKWELIQRPEPIPEPIAQVHELSNQVMSTIPDNCSFNPS